jgi:hypothetical protein
MIRHDTGPLAPMGRGMLPPYVPTTPANEHIAMLHNATLIPRNTPAPSFIPPVLNVATVAPGAEFTVTVGEAGAV